MGLLHDFMSWNLFPMSRSKAPFHRLAVCLFVPSHFISFFRRDMKLGPWVHVAWHPVTSRDIKWQVWKNLQWPCGLRLRRMGSSCHDYGGFASQSFTKLRFAFSQVSGWANAWAQPIRGEDFRSRRYRSVHLYRCWAVKHRKTVTLARQVLGKILEVLHWCFDMFYDMFYDRYQHRSIEKPAMNGGEQCHGARDPRDPGDRDSEGLGQRGQRGPWDSTKATKNTQPCGGDIQQCEARTQSLHVVAAYLSNIWTILFEFSQT